MLLIMKSHDVFSHSLALWQASVSPNCSNLGNFNICWLCGTGIALKFNVTKEIRPDAKLVTIKRRKLSNLSISLSIYKNQNYLRSRDVGSSYWQNFFITLVYYISRALYFRANGEKQLATIKKN